ncbi:MAG: metallophosphatase [Gomphosphaeria aponina SAG 52.96 = DSM 107014]|uniref:Metallophosphatase n=1 Tax=Gomphosphaeria aponina SAG 52.96 = DSM 107014 TaxID=1521640 RepID=A0A941JV94_9CHRO|nr:metallophosphatase [Gomphosphaeria aponina SAG 52.96 = DSM 107014]
MWAILSGIEGNLTAFQAVLRDIQTLNIEQLYILGDLVGINPDSEKVVQRIRYPHADELSPQVCRGWWEEQCIILHGLVATGEPTELEVQYGAETAKKLWDSVSSETVKWLAALEFGFVELDCLLIHGSTVSVSEELTPKTSPWQILDRLQRMEVNHLFCGRSGEVFDYELQAGSIATTVTTLDSQHLPQTMTTAQKRLIGVGSVGRKPPKATYTLYNPYTNGVEFRTVYY